MASLIVKKKNKDSYCQVFQRLEANKNTGKCKVCLGQNERNSKFVAVAEPERRRLQRKN